MKKFFKLLIFGHLFIWLSINIPFDILPNFVGWILIVAALEKVKAISAKRASPFAILLCILSFIRLWLPMQEIMYVPTFISLAEQFLTIIFYYFLFEILRDVATSLNEQSYTEKLRICFFIMQFGGFIGTATLIHTPLDIQNILIAVMAMYSFCIMFWFTIYLIRTGSRMDNLYAI